MNKIIVNKIKCKKCGDVIESLIDMILNFANAIVAQSMAVLLIYDAVAISKTGKTYQRLRKFRRNNPFYLLT